MPGELHDEKIYSSEIVTISDVRCRPCESHCGPEEHSARQSIAFARSGLFVKHVGSSEAVVDPNHVLFFGRDEAYRVSHPVPGGDDCTSFSFAAAILHDAVTQFDTGDRDQARGEFPLATCPVSARSALLHHGIRRAARLSASNLELDELAINLLADVTRSAYGFTGARPYKQRVATRIAHRRLADSVLRFVAARFREHLALRDIAKEVFASPFHLSRVFHRQVGVPIHRYVNRLRLHRALYRLAGGERDLTVMALDLGFAGHSHLTDAFKREFRVPPSNFRDNLTVSRLREMSKNLEVPESSLS